MVELMNHIIGDGASGVEMMIKLLIKLILSGLHMFGKQLYF